MAFLDNSGDILLDAVLTDTGRMRLAKGDGTFKIVKFALGDDEINYTLYNPDHASGSAYYDLEVLQTPLLEAFTNNTSMMQSKLMSIPRTNLLYLPIMKIVEQDKTTRNTTSTLSGDSTFGKFIVAVDERTAYLHNASSPKQNGIMGTTPVGIIDGSGAGTSAGATSYVRIDQGLNTSEISPSFNLSADLVETQYIIQMDNRLGRLVTAGAETLKPGNVSVAGAAGVAGKVSFIDDDNIATYYVSLNTDNQFVASLTNFNIENSTSIQGPRGTSLIFSVNAQIQLQQSNYLFTKLGQTDDATLTDANGGTFTGNYIDSTVRVMGATTGYKIDIPVRYVKRTA